ncbi:hypothetical protein Nepgr_013843 [Nepenthes gracilis]|uniref:GBF-interacting protein 1 N-terminal domain-containing protein n=1 Tax=Nepenthes gracilis TaxID=150966 RepID=A0AAD3SJZ1_NEPGR|nr:hypothetical protein Nepgr_013843 [Nepenthes gracilis]
MSGGFRVSTIPSNVRKTIQNLKEITGNNCEEEIYAMLKECSMDPNETVNRLLAQDTFHEVKRKRDRKKENLNNQETADSRWKTGRPPGRGSWGDRGNYSSRYAADARGGRNSALGKENGPNQPSDKASIISSSPEVQETMNREKTPIASSVTVMANGPIGAVSGGTKDVHIPQASAGSVIMQPEESEQKQSPIGASKKFSVAVAKRDGRGQSVPSSDSTSVSDCLYSASDPVRAPFNDSPGAVGATKREVESQWNPVERNSSRSTGSKPSTGSEFQNFPTQGRIKSQGAKNQLAEFSQPSSFSAHGGSSSSSRPSSNYGSRSQQVVASQKGLSKEWKPKATILNTVQGSKTPALSEELPVSVEAGDHFQPLQSVPNPEVATSEVQKELEGLNIGDTQHVFIPNHIHVPEAVRTGLTFGSFDAAFLISEMNVNDPESEKYSKPISETPEGVEAVVEPAMSQNILATSEEGDYADHLQSPAQVPETMSSGNVDAPSSLVPDINDSKEATGGPQQSIGHTSAYSFGPVPPMLGNPLAQFESSETQGQDVYRIPGSVQPVDPASLFAQFYRSGACTDGRVSPFSSAGVATNYNGNVATLATQTSLSSHEGGNSVVLSTSGQAPLASQAAGVMQNPIAVNQQAVPVFRQPAGVHIPHFPPNYFPYGHYFSPLYVPPPAIHQFLSNNAFSQQGQPGNIYPGPPAATAPGMKYSLAQYKPGNNTGNPTHIGVAGSYGPYGPSPFGYNPGSAATAGNSAANEDLAAAQFKESNVYITGQQSEGSAVWIAASNRDIASLPASSFYNLPPQSQHVTFTPTQAGHGTFAGIYHPAQAVTAAMVHPLLQQSQAMAGPVDMVGPATGVYQQPQHSQMNWPNNY